MRRIYSEKMYKTNSNRAPMAAKIALVGSSLFLSPSAHAQAKAQMPYDITINAPLVMPEQSKVPWIEFSFENARYIVLQEKRQGAPTVGDIDVYKLADPKTALKLTDEQKNALFDNRNVNCIILERLDERTYHPHTPLREMLKRQ
jgi:hypothetical protein